MWVLPFLRNKYLANSTLTHFYFTDFQFGADRPSDSSQQNLAQTENPDSLQNASNSTKQQAACTNRERHGNIMNTVVNKPATLCMLLSVQTSLPSQLTKQAAKIHKSEII